MNLKYKRHIIDDNPLGELKPNAAVGDLTGNGMLDLVIGSHHNPDRDPNMEDGYLVWYQAPDWKRHVVDTGQFHLGLTLHDVTGNGRPDIVIATDYPAGLVWYENRGAPEKPFVKHVVEENLQNYYHDLLFADIDGDGKDELVVSSPWYYIGYFKIPQDPAEPWKRITVNNRLLTEGLLVRNLNNGKVPVLFAGPHYFNMHNGGHTWPSHRAGKLTEDFRGACRLGWIRLKDGREGIVLCEAEYTDGKISYFEKDGSTPGRWKEHPIDKDIYFGHSLGIGDIDNDGSDEIFIGEMAAGGFGADAKPTARLMIYKCVDLKKNRWERTVISQGIGTHEAQFCDIFNNGRFHVLGKVWKEKHVDWWEPLKTQ